MKNNILQIVFNSQHSSLILDVEKYVRQFGTQFDAERIGSIVIERKDESWFAFSPEREPSKWIKKAAFLTLEYLLNLPVEFLFNSNGVDIETFLKSHYDERINIKGDKQTDNNLHLLVHIPINDSECVSNLEFLLNSIPLKLIDHIRVHLILYSSTTSIGNSYESLDTEKSKEQLHNIVNLFLESKYNAFKGRIIYISNYDEQGYCLNLSKENELSKYVGRILIYLINEFRALSSSMPNSSEISTFGLFGAEIDKFKIINNLFYRTLREILIAFIGKKNNNNDRIRDFFEEFIRSNQDIVRKEFESECISEDNIHSGILDYVKTIIDSKDLSLYDKDEILKRFNRLWNQNMESIEDDFSESTFEDIYMPLIYKLGLDTPYPQVKELLSEIKNRKIKIKKQEERLNELKRVLPPFEPNCFWTEEGIRVGDDLYRLDSQDSLLDDSPLEITSYEPVGNSFEKSRDIRNGFSSIRNQGNQGSCVSFSLVSIIEFYLNSGADKRDFSESFLYYTARALTHETEKDEGVAIEYALQSLKENGVCIEELCPYDEKTFNKKPSEEAYKEAINRRIDGAQKVGNCINDIKSALSEGYPIIGSFRVFKSLEKNTDGLVLYPTEEELAEEPKYHAMVICGYNDVNKYFIVRNSWGRSFGHNGYCYLPYSYVRDSNLTRGLYLVKMNEKSDISVITKDIDKTEDFSPRFSYEVNRNRISEEAYLLKEERAALHDAIIALRNVIAQIMANTDVNEYIHDIDEQIEDTKSQIVNIENNIRKLSKINKLIGGTIGGLSIFGISWSTYDSWLYYTKNIGETIYLPLTISVLSIIAPIIWFLIKSNKDKNNRLKFNNLSSTLEELKSLREQRIKAYEQLQQLLLVISSAELKVKRYDDNLSNIYTSFNGWLKEIIQIQNLNDDDESDIKDVKKETIVLADNIFNGENDITLLEKFMNYQLSLLRKFNKYFSKSVYDELRDEKIWNSFVENVINTKTPVELGCGFKSNSLIFLGDVSVLSPNNIELLSIKEIDRPNTVVDYKNPLLILGIVEKKFSIDDLTDLSL